MHDLPVADAKFTHLKINKLLTRSTDSAKLHHVSFEEGKIVKQSVNSPAKTIWG